MKIRRNSLISSWILPLLILPFFKPSTIAYISFLRPLSRAFDVWEIILCVIVVAYYLFKGRLTKFILALIIYEAIVGVSTLVNGVYNFNYLHMAIERIAFCMLLEICLRVDVKRCIRSIVGVLSVLCIINLITLILFPEGIYSAVNFFGQKLTAYWFLGLDNVTANYTLPLVYLWTVYATNEGFSLFKKYAGIVLFSLFIFLRWTASALVSVVIFIALIVISDLKLSNRLLNIRTYYLVHIGIFVSFVLLRIQKYFSYLIETVLKKDITFTGRLPIWDKAIESFWIHPILGWGMNFDRNYYIIRASHTHNFFLHTMYESGILGFASFMSILFLTAGKLLKSRSKFSYILSAAIFSFLLVYQMEVYSYMTSFFGLLTIAYHISTVDKALNSKG